MYKVILPILLALASFVSPVKAEAQAAKEDVSIQKALSSSNKVVGLELPTDQQVTSDEGFVVIKATSEGPVKWLVIGDVKYIEFKENKSLVISIPHENTQITVFAIAWVDGKFTDYARHNIVVTAKNPDNPNNPVNPDNPVNVGGPLHITFLIDLNRTTPELAAIVNSGEFRNWVKQKGDYFRYYDINSKIIKERKLDSVVSRVGGSAIMIVQDQKGVVIHASAVPKNETEVKNIINGLRK